MPANCAVLGLTLGYDYGRGSSSNIGKYFTCDDSSTVCCYPFLLSSLSFLHNLGNYYNYNDDNDDSGGHLEGFDTVYEYWYPNNRRQPARRQRRPTGGYGRRRTGNYRDSGRRYHRANRPPFSRYRHYSHVQCTHRTHCGFLFFLFYLIPYSFFLNRRV